MNDLDRVFREGGINQVSELLVTPARCGIYLTRARIRRLAAEMGLRAGVQSRARMVETLFREAGSEGRTGELLDRLDAEAATWLDRYRAWAKACPPAKSAWKPWTDLAKKLRREIRQAKKSARKIQAEFPEGS